MKINLHHLELFYYASLYGGPNRAPGKMPYGVTPATLRAGLRDLERETGACLYQRRSFKLTPIGEKLFAFLRPLFEDLPGLIQVWGKGLPGEVRLGASAVVLREYLPPILAAMKQRFPGLRLTCSEGTQKQLEVELKEKKIDVAVMILDGDLPADYQSEPVARVPLVLLVPKKSKLRMATELWRRGQIAETLVSLPEDNPVNRCFQKGLKRRGVDWPIGLRATSLELVESYVINGLGLGLSLRMPGRRLAGTGLRELALADFPYITVGVAWRRNAGEAIQALIREIRRASKQPTTGKSRIANRPSRDGQAKFQR